MQNLVHLSYGPRSNLLNTLFYNTQREYFVYTPEQVKTSKVDPNVRFSTGKEYTPRAGFWDFKGGFGKLQKVSEVYEDKELDIEDEIQKMTTDSVNTWTDHLQVALHPSSKHEIANWIAVEGNDDGKVRGSLEGDDKPFALFDEGRDEFQFMNSENMNDYVEETVQPIFEKCDIVSGINLCSDFSGWSGFSTQFLQALRDDYVPKTAIISWVQHQQQRVYRRDQIDSYLETLLEFNEYSDLIIPTTLRGSDSENIAQLNLVFETVSLMSSLRTNLPERLTMDELIYEITKDTDAKIVEARAATGHTVETVDIWSPRMSTTKYDFGMDLFNLPLRKRNKKPVPKVYKSVIGFDRPNSPDAPNMLFKQQFNKERLLEDGVTNVYDHTCPQRSYSPLVGDYGLYVELNLSNAPTKLRELCTGWNHSLRERTYDMTEPYLSYWDQDSDSDID